MELEYKHGVELEYRQALVYSSLPLGVGHRSVTIEESIRRNFISTGTQDRIEKDSNPVPYEH